MTRYLCCDCEKARAVAFNPDGRYRCKPCQREHVALVRAVLRAGRALRPSPGDGVTFQRRTTSPQARFTVTTWSAYLADGTLLGEWRKHGGAWVAGSQTDPRTGLPFRPLYLRDWRAAIRVEAARRTGPG